MSRASPTGGEDEGESTSRAACREHIICATAHGRRDAFKLFFTFPANVLTGADGKAELTNESQSVELPNTGGGCRQDFHGGLRRVRYGTTAPTLRALHFKP